VVCSRCAFKTFVFFPLLRRSQTLEPVRPPDDFPLPTVVDPPPPPSVLPLTPPFGKLPFPPVFPKFKPLIPLVFVFCSRPPVQVTGNVGIRFVFFSNIFFFFAEIGVHSWTHWLFFFSLVGCNFFSRFASCFPRYCSLPSEHYNCALHSPETRLLTLPRCDCWSFPPFCSRPTFSCK